MKMMQSNSNGDSEMNSMNQEMLENVKMNDVSYEVTTDKENYYMTGAAMDIDVAIQEQGETMNSQQTTKITVENFNKAGRLKFLKKYWITLNHLKKH